MKKTETPHIPISKQPSVFSVLGPYKKTIVLLVLFALITNALTLVIPLLIARGIDSYTAGTLLIKRLVIEFSIATFFIFLFLYLQNIVQTYASERVGRDLRTKIIDAISRRSYASIQAAQPAKVLTNLTGDVDSIKLFVSQAIVTMVSSVVVIIGIAILLLSINWKLALVVLAVIPLIGGVFGFIFSKVKTLFVKGREAIDWLNTVINESILGAGIIRVVHAQNLQYKKFLDANTNAQNVGLRILGMFAALIPAITFIAGLATVGVLLLGGKFTIAGSLSLGDFSAFYTYLSLLIFPILMIGFMSSLIAQATASYGRISAFLAMPESFESGTITSLEKGTIELKHVTMLYGEQYALKDISLTLKAGTKTAIIGPTAAGKTQLLYVLTGLLSPTEGSVLYDGRTISEYDAESFHNEIGLVFQDSIMFNMSIRENIAFNAEVTEESLMKAIKASELSDFIDALPHGLDTIVSERGTSLSGGQKQRIMLARALAINPKILFLDDFTARVDARTEKTILDNIARMYPDITLVSVTQKISSIEEYDSIVVLMEGELLAQGTHVELMNSSPEYVQMYTSQKSTNTYELRS